MGDASTTKPVWTIDKSAKKKWNKKNSKDTKLVKKFKKFEESVTDEPYPYRNRAVKKLKGDLSDTLEYKKRPVRGIYQLDEPNTTIKLIDFNWKESIEY